MKNSHSQVFAHQLLNLHDAGARWELFEKVIKDREVGVCRYLTHQLLRSEHPKAVADFLIEGFHRGFDRRSEVDHRDVLLAVFEDLARSVSPGYAADVIRFALDRSSPSEALSVLSDVFDRLDPYATRDLVHCVSLEHDHLGARRFATFVQSLPPFIVMRLIDEHQTIVPQEDVSNLFAQTLSKRQRWTLLNSSKPTVLAWLFDHTPGDDVDHMLNALSPEDLSQAVNAMSPAVLQSALERATPSETSSPSAVFVALQNHQKSLITVLAAQEAEVLNAVSARATRFSEPKTVRPTLG